MLRNYTVSRSREGRWRAYAVMPGGEPEPGSSPPCAPHASCSSGGRTATSVSSSSSSSLTVSSNVPKQVVDGTSFSVPHLMRATCLSMPLTVAVERQS